MKNNMLFILIFTSTFAWSQTKVIMSEEGGVYTMPCEVNGLILKFIFDTGASEVSISLAEALFMLKNGYLNENDIFGSTYHQIANGDIVEGTAIILRQIKIGDKYIYNVKASIVHSLSAPLLLGQSALKKIGDFSFDYSNKLLILEGRVKDKINWMTWEQMINKHRIEKKKIIVDLYTDWCGWCKRMDETTFSDPLISIFINQNFYPVKLNGEMKEDLVFEGVTYKFVNHGRRGYHEFAASLSENPLSYPSFIFLNEDIQVIQVIPGYKDAKGFEYILNFFGGDYYKHTPYTQFQKNFKSSF